MGGRGPKPVILRRSRKRVSRAQFEGLVAMQVARCGRRADRDAEGCTLEELNAILWPSGKRMPGRP